MIDAFNVCYRNLASFPIPSLEPGEPDTGWELLLLLTDWGARAIVRSTRTAWM